MSFTTFAMVQAALNKYIGPPNNFAVAGAPHRVFWERGATYDEQYEAFVTGDAISGFPIMEKGNGPGSNVILALEGKPPFDGSTFPRMPVGGPPWLDQATIDGISGWITAGAPK